MRGHVSGIEQDHERIEQDNCVGNIIKHIYSCWIDEVQQLHAQCDFEDAPVPRSLLEAPTVYNA
jgi:hypothetical protein